MINNSRKGPIENLYIQFLEKAKYEYRVGIPGS